MPRGEHICEDCSSKQPLECLACHKQSTSQYIYSTHEDRVMYVACLTATCRDVVVGMLENIKEQHHYDYRLWNTYSS